MVTEVPGGPEPGVRPEICGRAMAKGTELLKMPLCSTWATPEIQGSFPESGNRGDTTSRLEDVKKLASDSIMLLRESWISVDCTCDERWEGAFSATSVD